MRVSVQNNELRPQPNRLVVIERRKNPYPAYQEDEISLVDLAVPLIKRKTLILVVAGGCVLAGTLYALARPSHVEFITAIEVGRIARGDNPQLLPIGPIKTVQDKLDKGYIPAVQDEMKQANPEDAMVSVKTEISKDSELVILKSIGREEDRPAYRRLHQAVVDRIVSDHRRITDVEKGRLNEALTTERIKLAELQAPNTLALKKKVLEAQINDAALARDALYDPAVIEVEKGKIRDDLERARLKLEELKDPRVLGIPKRNLEAQIVRGKQALNALRDGAKILKARYDNLDELGSLLKKQIAALGGNVNSAIVHRQTIVGTAVNDGNAMAVLMIDSQIQRDRDRLGGLEERLYVDLPDLRAKLDKEIEDNKRAQEAQIIAVQELEGKLEKLLVDNERDQTRQRLIVAELEAQYKKYDVDKQRARKQLEPALPRLETKFEKMLEDHNRAIVVQKESIAKLENQWANVLETQAVAVATPTADTHGKSKAVIILLAGMLGLMLGVFLAYVAEFLAKARQRLAEGVTTIQGSGLRAQDSGLRAKG